MAAELQAFGFRWFDSGQPRPLATWLDRPDEELLAVNRRVAATHFNLADLPGGHTALIKGVDYYARQRNADRLATCMRSLAVAVGDRGDLVPDRLVPDYVRLLETARTPYPPVIRLMGRLGRRGRPALPALRAIRDGPDTRLELAADQAIRQIESSKEK